MADTYDVIVIGAGPGGYVAAIRAAQLGLKTAVVDREHLGGICLNWGCIPTKALLRSAEIYHYMEHAKDYGLSAEKIGFDGGAIVKRSRGVSERLSTGVGFLMKKNKVDVIWGEAKLDAPGKVAVAAATKSVQGPPTPAPKGALGPGTYQAKHVIVATGARPRVLPGIEPDKKLIWTYFEAMVPERMPKSLLVIGSGAIGIEFASFYRTMGAEVTGVEKAADAVTATIDDGNGGTQKITAERLISAVGVVGNTENLGLEKLGVKIDRGTIVTDGLGRTNVPGVYAIGDVAGPPMLAHKAEHEGVLCVEAIKGLNNVHPMDKNKI